MSIESLRRWDADVVLRDGSTLHVRPLQAEDATAMRALHERMSPQSRFQRFMTASPRLDESVLANLSQVDYQNSFALVGEAAGRLVAAAHYFRCSDDATRAEVAFVIEDALQGRGIGMRLLELLAEVAREHGIQRFDADVLGSNQKMMDLFLHCGFEVQRRLSGGEYQVSFSIAPTPAYEASHARRAGQAAAASMEVFFEPSSVAVVGAGRRPGLGHTILRNVLTHDFGGVVYAVHPTDSSVCGVKAYPSIRDIPDPVDLAILVVPAGAVSDVIDDCIAHHVRGVVVISAGFAECGASGRQLERELLEKVRAAGIRMIGPNCMGVLNTDSHFCLNATFAPGFPPRGPIALATQSGALGLAIIEYARNLNLGVSSFASLGNKTDVSGNDLIQYWAGDEHTRVILLYLESFGNPRRFARIAPGVARRKPIIAVKSGRSQAGSRAAASHSAAMASTDAAVDALFRQAGIIRTDTLQEMFDVGALLAHQPVPAGRRVAIVSNAGGPAILAADACEAHGLQLPTLDPSTVSELRSFLPPVASVNNPVDTIAAVTADNYERALRTVLRDPNVDSLIAIYIPLDLSQAPAYAAAMVAGASEAGPKTVIATYMSVGENTPRLGSLPRYAFPESAAVALSRAVQYREFLNRPLGTVPRFVDVRAAEAAHVVAEALERGGGWLGHGELCELMRAAGIPTAESRLVGLGLDQALEAADELGYPVALKALGPGLLHKTEVGGVRLHLKDAHELRTAHADLVGRLGERLQNILLQRMVENGVEVAIGATLDADFGPLLMYGSGGTMVELQGDVVFGLQPLTDVDARDMLNRVRGTARLRGYRGAPKADEDAVCDALLRLSALLEACPQIAEVDINPLIVGQRGAVAVDARVRVERPSPPALSRRVLY